MVTKKYIFQCKLNGNRIILTANGHAEWYELIKFMCKHKILLRVNRAKIDKQVREYSINYPITINDIGRTKYVTQARCRFSFKDKIHLVACQNLQDEDDCLS